jgi:hypothetical protein
MPANEKDNISTCLTLNAGEEWQMGEWVRTGMTSFQTL